MTSRRSFLSLTAKGASLIAISLAVGCHAAQQPAGNAPAPAVALQPYTAPDQSASAGVPSGWQVSKGGQTVITMTGPQGETVSLGNTFVAKNAAFQPGRRGSNGIDLSMPSGATLSQKLAMIIQGNAVAAGKTAPQFTVTSATPIQLPAALGQCGRFVANLTDATGQTKVMAVFCSLAVDAGGTYKNIMLYAQAPAAVAAQSAPTALAIFQSYRIPPAWLQKKLAPNVAPPPPAQKAGPGAPANPNALADQLNGETIRGMAGADVSDNCFSLAMRDTPTYQLPKSCGGPKPD
jgi:hypothetical protein